MNLPNKLTVFRIILVPIIVLFLLCEQIPGRYFMALLLFFVASYTDYLDGKIARKNNLITDFGKLEIHAPAGSYAETYAKENNIPFVAE